MKTIETKFGVFYIEDFNSREEDARVKLYDSNVNYLDYLPIESGIDETEEEQYDGYLSMLETFETAEDLMDWLVCQYEFVGTKDETIKYLHEELNWELPSEDYNPLDNEWINRIGNYYIVVCEY